MTSNTKPNTARTINADPSIYHIVGFDAPFVIQSEDRAIAEAIGILLNHKLTHLWPESGPPIHYQLARDFVYMDYHDNHRCFFHDVVRERQNEICAVLRSTRPVDFENPIELGCAEAFHRRSFSPVFMTKRRLLIRYPTLKSLLDERHYLFDQRNAHWCANKLEDLLAANDMAWAYPEHMAPQA